MPKQVIRLLLTIKTMGINTSVLTTIKYLAYRLGHERFANAYNAFDGGKATPALRGYFADLVDEAVPVLTSAENFVESGPGYVSFDLTFYTPITIKGATYLLNVMRPFLRNALRTPLVVAYVDGQKVFFVHYFTEGMVIDYRLCPFTSEITMESSPEDILAYLKERVADAPTTVEERLRTLYDAAT